MSPKIYGEFSESMEKRNEKEEVGEKGHFPTHSSPASSFQRGNIHMPEKEGKNFGLFPSRYVPNSFFLRSSRGRPRCSVFGKRTFFDPGHSFRFV